MTPVDHSEDAPLRSPAWPPGAMVRRLMLVVALAVLVVGGAVTLWLIRAGEQEAMRRMAEQQNDEVEMVARLLAAKVEQNQKVLSTVAASITPSMLESPVTIEWLLQQGLPATRFFDMLHVARPNGEVIIHLRHGHVESASEGGLETVERDYLRRTLAQGKPLVSEPIAGETRDGRILFTMPLHREDGGVIGVVGGAIRLQSQGLLPPSMVLPQRVGSRLVVFTREGRILAHSDPERIMAQAQDEPGLAQAYSQWLRRGQPVQARASTETLDGQIVSLAGMPIAQWMVARVSDVKVLLPPAQTALQTTWLRVGGLVMVLALLAALVVAWVARPLTSLYHRALRMQALLPVPANSRPVQNEADALVNVLIDLERRRKDQHLGRMALAEQFQLVIDTVPVGVLITAGEQLKVVNRRAEEMLGYRAQALQGEPVRVLFASGQEYEAMQQQLREEFAAHGFFHGELSFRRQDGSTVWARVKGHSLHTEAARTDTVWILEDMTVAREALRQQGWVALYDPLTMLLNRQAFEQRLAEVLQNQRRACDGDDKGVVLFLDLDHFTGLNALAGHDAGDDALRHVARLIDAQVRQLGYVGRLGGDEFGVLLPGCAPARGLAVAERLCAELQAWAPQYEGHSFTMGASIGIVVLTPHLKTVGQVLHAADMACYEAKRAGRNRVAWHSPMQEQADRA